MGDSVKASGSAKEGLFWFLGVIVAVGVAVIGARAYCLRDNVGESIAFSAMGTSGRIVIGPAGFVAPSAKRPGHEMGREELMGTALAAIREIEADLSIFNASGTVARINAAAGTDGLFVLSEQAKITLDTAIEVNKASGGMFDPSVGPLMTLWGFRNRNPGDEVTLPDAATISNTLELVGLDKVVEYDKETGRCRLTKAGARLDFGGVAKGTGADAAMVALARSNCGDCLVALGGTIATQGRNGMGGPWRIAVRNPFYEAEVAQGETKKWNGDAICTLLFEDGEATSTSGSYEQYVEIGGRKYSHIMDPRTGRPTEWANCAQATVITGSAALSDALSTALFILGDSQASRDLADAFPNTRAMLVCGTPSAPRIVDIGGFMSWVDKNSPYEEEFGEGVRNAPAKPGKSRRIY